MPVSKFEKNDQKIEMPFKEIRAEKEAGPEEVAERLILQLDKEVEEIQLAGSDRIANANRSIGLENDEKERIKNEMRIDEKQNSINIRGMKLVQATKKSLRNLVVYGMAAMTLAGAGKIEKPQDKTFKSPAAFSDTVNAGIGGIRQTDPNISLRRIEKETKIIKDQIEKHVGSREYLDKLKIEFKGDIKAAKEIQQKRLENIKNLKISFLDSKELSADFFRRTAKSLNIEKNISSDTKKFLKAIKSVNAFYSAKENKAFLPKDKFYPNDAQHEILHGVTLSDNDISSEAKQKLTGSYKSTDRKTDPYFKISTERKVRMDALNFDMERLKIKKYGEKFNEKHYKKIMEAFKKRKLSSDSMEFIEKTKPEYFETIFNNIAQNEKDDSVRVSSA